MSVKQVLLSIGLVAALAVTAAQPAQARERELVPAVSCGEIKTDSGNLVQLGVGNVSCETGQQLIAQVWAAREADPSLEFVQIDGWRCYVRAEGGAICGKADQGVGTFPAGRDLDGTFFGSIPEKPRLYMSRSTARNYVRLALIANYPRTWPKAKPRKIQCGRRFSLRAFRCVSSWANGKRRSRSVLRARILPPMERSRVRVSGQTISTDWSCRSVRAGLEPCVSRETLATVVFRVP